MSADFSDKEKLRESENEDSSVSSSRNRNSRLIIQFMNLSADFFLFSTLNKVSSQIGEVRNDLKCGKSAGFAICSSANRSESCCNHSIGKCLNSKEKSTCDCPTCVDFSALSRGLMQIRAKLAQGMGNSLST